MSDESRIRSPSRTKSAGLSPAEKAAGNWHDKRDARRDDFTVKRFFDPKYGMMSVKILPGEYYVSDSGGEMLVTVLGSCVAACIRDPFLKIGGMNHFMLPEGEAKDWTATNAALRYGHYAMEKLLNELFKRGAKKNRLEIKIFGGANVIASSSLLTVGQKNAVFVLNYLRGEGLPVEASDLGGNHGRRIHYFPEDGQVKRLLLRRQGDEEVFEKEQSFRRDLNSHKEDGGDIELFD